MPAVSRTVSTPKMKVKPPLKKQFSTLSAHSHRLSLGDKSDIEDELEEHEKPYNAPIMRIFGLNKQEWPYNLIGNFSLIERSFHNRKVILRK